MLHHHFVLRDDLAKGLAGAGPVHHVDPNGPVGRVKGLGDVGRAGGSLQIHDSLSNWAMALPRGV